MPVFVDASSQDAPIGEKFPLGFAESVKTGFEETMISGPFYGGLLANEIRKANQTGNPIDLATAKARAQEAGVPDLRIPAQGMTDQGLEAMIAIAQDRAEGEEKLSRASGVGAFAGSLVGSMDPVAGPLNFVPIVGGAREAAILAKASAKMGVTGRILARGAIGAAEGVVGAGITVPLNAITREAVGDDYTVDDAFSEVVSSAVLGGVAQAGLGQIGEAVAPFADRSSHRWVREKFGTESQEWRTLVEHDKRVAEAIAPDHVKADEAPRVDVDPTPARGIESDPDRVVEAGPAATLREAIGNRPVIYEASTREDPLAVEIVAAMRVSQAEIAKAPQNFEPIAKAMDALTLDRNSGFSIEEGIQFGSLKTLEPYQLDAARTAMALSGQPERMARFVAQYVEGTRRGLPPEAATNRAISKISIPEGPAEKGRIASELTMTNAEAIADFQAKSGIVIAPERVIDADARIQQADASTPTAEVARAMDPANRYDAKELREGADKMREMESLPDEDDFETLADEAEAELERLRTVTEGAGARFAEGGSAQAEASAGAADAVRAEIAERFGDDLVKLGEANGLQIVDSWRDIPGAKSERTIGMTEDGKVWIAANGIAKGQAASVYLHEMGAHVGLQKMLGEKGFADLQTKVSGLLDKSPELAAIIRAAVPRDTDPRFHAEEQLAYLVQNFEQGLAARGDWWPKGANWARITDPEVRRAIVDLVREIVAQAKAWLYENAPSLRGMPLDERDIHALAVRALRSAGEASSGTRFAKAAEEADAEIAAAKDLSKRVREVYKKAYDKLAAAPELDDDALVVAAQSAGMEKAEAVEMVKRFRKMGGNVAEALKDDMNKAELVRYRAVLNALKLHEGVSQILRFKGNETEGALSLDAGSEWNVQGARRSVESQRKGWEKTLVGGAEWELTEAKLFDLASDREQAPHIIHALFDLQTGRKPDGAKYNDDHAKIAEIINRYQERSLKEQRRRGVDIGQIKGRMLHQSHDTWALRNFANGKRTGATRSAIRDLLGRVLPDRWVKIGDDAHMKAWVEFVGPLLEPETYDGRAVDMDYLEGSYKLLAGFKEPSKDRELLSGKYSTGGVPGEAARLSNLGRNMKFKGPDEWIAYQKRCGNPDLLANFFGEQSATARSLGILDIYGPGGENTRATLHQAIGQQLVGKPAMDWQNGRKKRETQWAVTSGKISIPGNEVLANVASNTRSLVNSAIMGGSVLSQAPDMANAGKWRALRFNRNASGIYTEAAAQMQDFARAVSGSPKIRQILESWRADLDATVGGLLRAVEDGDSKGFTANLVEKVYKYQGATWFNRNNRHASTLGFSAWLGSESRFDFNGIEPTTRDMLLQHEIRENTWNLIRQSEQIAEDGRSYLTPEGVNGIPEKAIADHLEKLGRKATPSNIAQWREDIKARLIAMVSDEVSKSLMEPTGRQRATATGGLSAGTWSGEFIRTAWQAKSFAISQIQRGWMSEIRGRSSDPRARIRSGSGSHYLAIANYVAALTALGYVSYTLKGWASGVNRPGMFESGDEDDKVLFFDLPAFDDRVLFASMNQGGGLGIYGDFLFADADRFGGGFMQTLSGPTIGKLEDAYKLWNSAKSADPEDAGKLANQAVRMLKGSIPFSNLWYSRQIMDRLIWWNLQESINPAGLRRLEAAAEKRGDTYIFTRPTNALN